MKEERWLIRFEKVSKVFEDGTEALHNVSLTIEEGKLTVIIGPSGCGKTTLMKMINRLVVPSSGEMFIDGKAVSSLDEVKLRRTIGYVIQRIGLFPHMTIEKNASLVPNLIGWTKEKTTERIHALMKMVGLDPEQFLGKYPLELSGGQQQRIGVVRALAGNPEIVLMDEPFSAKYGKNGFQVRILSISSFLAETSNIGIFLTARICLQISKPFIPGSMISRIIKS